MKAFRKLHKVDTPTRPVINFRNAPEFRVAKFITKILNNTLDLLYTFNVRNSTKLIEELKHTDITPRARLFPSILAICIQIFQKKR
jgi:hypothetical protein